MSALKLLAEDNDDLQVISAALQDAVARIGDISYEQVPRRLTIAFNRFRWEKGKARERVRTAPSSISSWLTRMWASFRSGSSNRRA